MDSLTLDQFVTFVTVVDEGGFAAAARHMGRAQSAVTYAIHRLEEQGGAPLFDRSEYRPRLTDAGRSLLPHARRILADLARYRTQAKAMTLGVEAEVRVAVPESMPTGLLIEALARLRAAYPTVGMRIATESTAAALRQLQSGTIDLAVLFDRFDLPDWLRRVPCFTTPLIAVAAPAHPLADLPAPLSTDVLADHFQIVVSSRLKDDRGIDHGVVAPNRWHVTDHAVKRALLIAGLGWGGMPEHLIAQDIADGRLVRLAPESWDGAATLPVLPFVAGINGRRVAGPAAMELLRLLGNAG